MPKVPDNTEKEIKENPERSRKTVTWRRSLVTREYQPPKTGDSCPKLLGTKVALGKGRTSEIKFVFGIYVKYTNEEVDSQIQTHLRVRE